ncbi:MAG: Dam family site-specific DNA-(adenine-N6)-methyltransferase [Alphaproteobacteria bacterium]|nr:Dam family site-specific DNA-(adenine-N6)-methyltransferase [Alphaproteobacteria bacterium]
MTNKDEKISVLPFLKWAGGKRWLLNRREFGLPQFSGRYIEPFLGGGAVFFHVRPQRAILSDVNPRLIETYQAIRDDHERVLEQLAYLQKHHDKSFYYKERSRKRRSLHKRAAQFLYLNRTCWNGLYRENLKGEFNVPIGTKDKVIYEDEDFALISSVLTAAEIVTCDFECTIDRAEDGDLVFVDPPYTTAHNMNGFVKYNQNIFTWDDQVRLKEAIVRALYRNAQVVLTNADHQSIHELYQGVGDVISVPRSSVISGKSEMRRATSEALYYFGIDEGGLARGQESHE